LCRALLSEEKTASTCGLVEVLLEIGQERARIMKAMKVALLRGDDAEALDRARELTGIPTLAQTTFDT
jgi:hypothetical protein